MKHRIDKINSTREIRGINTSSRFGDTELASSVRISGKLTAPSDLSELQRDYASHLLLRGADRNATRSGSAVKNTGVRIKIRNRRRAYRRHSPVKEQNRKVVHGRRRWKQKDDGAR